MAQPDNHRIAEIISALRVRYKALNLHYEAAWTDSWTHRRCYNNHSTLLEAAHCAMPNGAGWYVIAVELGSPRQLTNAEEGIVNEFRFSRPKRTYAIKWRIFGESG